MHATTAMTWQAASSPSAQIAASWRQGRGSAAHPLADGARALICRQDALARGGNRLGVGDQLRGILHRRGHQQNSSARALAHKGAAARAPEAAVAAAAAGPLLRPGNPQPCAIGRLHTGDDGEWAHGASIRRQTVAPRSGGSGREPALCCTTRGCTAAAVSSVTCDDCRLLLLPVGACRAVRACPNSAQSRLTPSYAPCCPRCCPARLPWC
jgi:hypothetical protein